MKRCGKCGKSKFGIKNIKGTFHEWKDYTHVELLEDQQVTVCENCGNVIMGIADVLVLDKNIRNSIKRKLTDAILFLTNEAKVPQLDLASALGITPEYLSMVKNGKKKLSFTAFNLLMCFKEYPHLLMKLAGIKYAEPPEIADLTFSSLLRCYSGRPVSEAVVYLGSHTGWKVGSSSEPERYLSAHKVVIEEVREIYERQSRSEKKQDLFNVKKSFIAKRENEKRR
jgi:hypothetical protein